MQLEPERLVKILEVLRELPVANYRCVEPLPTQSLNSALSAQALSPPGALACHFSLLPHLNPTPACVFPM